MGFASYLFLLREEREPHLITSISGQAFSDCTAALAVSVENVGGRVWTIASASAFLIEPNLGDSATNIEDRRVSMDADGEPRVLRIGEETTYIFSVRRGTNSDAPFLEIGVLVRIEEEGEEWLRYSQGVVENPDCSS